MKNDMLTKEKKEKLKEKAKKYLPLVTTGVGCALMLYALKQSGITKKKVRISEEDLRYINQWMEIDKEADHAYHLLTPVGKKLEDFKDPIFAKEFIPFLNAKSPIETEISVIPGDAVLTSVYATFRNLQKETT